MRAVHSQLCHHTMLPQSFCAWAPRLHAAPSMAPPLILSLVPCPHRPFPPPSPLPLHRPPRFLLLLASSSSHPSAAPNPTPSHHAIWTRFSAMKSSIVFFVLRCLCVFFFCLTRTGIRLRLFIVTSTFEFRNASCTQVCETLRPAFVPWRPVFRVVLAYAALWKQY